MSMLERLVQTPLVQSLGLALFHSLWQGAVAALVLLAVLFVTPSPRVRYVCAVLTMLATLLSFAVAFLLLLPRTAAPLTVGALPPSTPTASGNIFNGSSFSVFGAAPWLALSWMVGVVLFYLHGAAGWMAARRLRNRGVCPAPDRWVRCLVLLQSALRLRRPVALLESCLAQVPMVVGFLRPAILFPVGMLTSMPPGQIEAILLHELAHIRRGDYLVNLLQTFVEGLLFYHPAIWWISGVIRAERENCCDDVVVATTCDTLQYAAALTAIEQVRSRNHLAAMAANGGSLMSRIRRLLNPRASRRSALAPFLSVTVLAVAALTLGAWQTPYQSAATPALQNWVTDDVAYIVTDQERAAFNALGTDEERSQFVKQFWERRNPVPGSARNDFKEEHYRRIGYANEHFGGRLPGWKTDMGRIYITYGPPDEIDSHPSGGVFNRPLSEGGGQVLTYPFEQWLYRYIQGIGNMVRMEFVDGTRTGEYLMTRDPREKYENSDQPVEPKVK